MSSTHLLTNMKRIIDIKLLTKNRAKIGKIIFIYWLYYYCLDLLWIYFVSFESTKKRKKEE